MDRQHTPNRNKKLEIKLESAAVFICKAKLPACADPRSHTSPGDETTPAHSRSQGYPPFVGLGLDATVKLVPSQCNSSVIWCPDPSAAKLEPNAQMSLAEFAVNPSKRFD